MAATNPPKGDRTGNDYHEGSNPNPGGDIDTSDSTLPPYEDRTKGSDGRSEGTARAMGSEPPVKEPAQPGSDEGHPDADRAPEGVGESITEPGDDVMEDEGQEPGHTDTGTDDGPVHRPTGGSNPRDETGVDAQQSNTGRKT